MFKLSNKKNFFITVFLMVVLLFSFYSYAAPNARATQLSLTAEKGLSITNQATGLNLTKYTVESALNANGLYRNTLPSEDFHYVLTSSGSKVEVLETFVNSSLVMIDVLEMRGSPLMTMSNTSPLLMAHSFLNQYANDTGNQFYNQLANLLNNVDVTENSSKVFGNLKFDVNFTKNSSTGQSTTFTWSFTANGVSCASKCVSLCYINGFLKDFVDTWNLYKVGSTTLNVSKQQAETTAVQKAKTFTWTDGSDSNPRIINNFNVTKPMYETIVFCEAGNLTNARNADPLTIYPMWRIGVGLDKYYPGNVYGIYVDIWADSGEIRGIREASTNLPPPPNATMASIADCSVKVQTSATISKIGLTMLLGFIMTALGAMSIVLFGNKKLLRSQLLPKIPKATAIILCFLIGSITVISAVPSVNASGASDIWGANSAGDPYLRHSSSERYYQGILSSYIDYLFWTCGYNNNNYQGSQTVPSNVLSYTNSAEQNEGIATVYFDHGIGMKNWQSQPYLDPQLRIPDYDSYPNEWHYMLAGSYAIPNDPTGDTFDYQIYNATTPNYNYFNWISTCLSADLGGRIPLLGGTGTYGPNPDGTGAPIGMPYAWTHVNTTETPVDGAMSYYGYWSPDFGPYCYIGFPYGSPSLSQPLDDEYPTALYYDFVHSFFYNALSLQMTVKQALDAASLAYWAPYLFCSNKLAYDFTAHWEGYTPDQSGCYMNIYGNTNMYLYAGGPDYASPPSVSGPTSGDSYTEYWFSAPSTDPMGYSLTYTFDWGDGSSPTITSDPYDVPHIWYSSGVYPITVTAQSDTGVFSSPTYYYIGIDQEPTLEVDTLDQNGNGLAANILVDNNWIGCGYGSTPVSIGWHYIEADNWVWDDYYSTYVFPVSGIGWVFVGPDTYIHVYYTY